MHRGAHLDAALGAKAAGQAQHLSAIGLHGEIAMEAGIETRPGIHPPAKYRGYTSAESGVIYGGIRPAPKYSIDLPMLPD